MSKLIQKFYIKKSSIYLSVALVVICAIAYILCTFFLNIEGMVQAQSMDTTKIAMLQTGKDILLIFISLFGANLLLGLLIEVNSKNALVSDIIMNDVVSAPEFYENLPADIQTAMCNALERRLFFPYDSVHNMFQNIRSRLIDTIRDYYFCNCTFVVSCNVKETYIEKVITRKVSLKSYENTFTITNYSLGQFKSKTISGLQPYEIESVEINGVSISSDDYGLGEDPKMRHLDEQNQYDSSMEYVYKKPIEINNQKETTVSVKYVTRTSKDDRISTFRVGKPCQNFSLIYSVIQQDKYRLAVDAFGFLDNADDSANNSSDSNVNICFSDWIFRYDGVTVVLLDK
ncbi:MAG: hypothetical protein NC079_00645 [Clostridium sp.]|nr:hypothetical protein [Acetatifactor muris]MCM1527455.1 hypothetical protein [Bacteroides sp.]MCM1562099.1 hypothetical protein [Clostridium sp.]